jgi:hypothetical protein
MVLCVERHQRFVDSTQRWQGFPKRLIVAVDHGDEFLTTT